MRSPFIVMLLATILFCSWYFYKTANACVVPQSYSIGIIDPRFELATSTVETLVTQATEVWESQAGRNLFVYDPKADFKVEFIYDDRQATSDQAESQKEVLSEKEAASKKISEEYTKLVTQYDELKKDYDAEVAQYQRRLNIFNATVERYNNEGGAPENEFAQLQKTEATLKTEERKLEGTADTLSGIAKDINRLSEEGNAVISEYNERVNRFNENFTDGEEFTQGDYTGDAIHVYHFKDGNELKNVLVHEFGHALGLPHVEGSSSIMYYLMDKQPSTSDLSPEDVAALEGICLPTNSAVQRLHQQFSSLFIKVGLL